MGNGRTKMFLRCMVIPIESLKMFDMYTHIISNMPPSRNISLFILSRYENLHSFHTPNTRHTESAESSEKIFLVYWHAVLRSIKPFGFQETEADVTMQHAHF